MRRKTFFVTAASVVLLMWVHNAAARDKVENVGFSDLVATPEELPELAPANISADVVRASQIKAGQSKGDVSQLLGEPKAVTTINNQDGWEYQLSLPLQDGRSEIVCQFMVVYAADTSTVVDAYWRRPQCAGLAEEIINESADLLFGFDDYKLKPESLPRLKEIAATANEQFSPVNITVTGHTDHLGSADYNKKLSERRAQSVVDYLISQDVPSQSIHAEGRGESDPIETCDGVTPKEALIDCLAPNRRVVIHMQSA